MRSPKSTSKPTASWRNSSDVNLFGYGEGVIDFDASYCVSAHDAATAIWQELPQWVCRGRHRRRQ